MLQNGTSGTQEEAAHAYDVAAIEYRGINAVTNFDLSTYIRWLRPGASNNLQDPQLHTGQLQAIQQQSNLFPYNADARSLANRRLSAVDELQMPCKQGFMPHHMTGIKSSPSALDLLLRSSVFQQLVEKNSNTTDAEIERQGAKDANEYNEILYESTAEADENNPYYDKNEHGIWNGILEIP